MPCGFQVPLANCVILQCNLTNSIITKIQIRNANTKAEGGENQRKYELFLRHFT